MTREKLVRCSTLLRSTCALAGLVALLAAPGPVAAAGRAVPIAVSPGSATEFASSPIACPPFSWTLLPEALEYELVVVELPHEHDRAQPGEPPAPRGFDELGEVVLRHRVPGGANHWLPPSAECVSPAGNFAWAVRARLGDGWGPWSEPLLFAAPGPRLVTAVPAPAPVGEGSGPAAILEAKSSHGPAIAADGVIESTSGGFRFPDGQTQIHAFRLTVIHGAVDEDGNKIFGNIESASQRGTGDYLVDLGRIGLGCSVTVTPGVYNPPTGEPFTLPKGFATVLVFPTSEIVTVHMWPAGGGGPIDYPFFLVAVCSPLNFGF